MPIRLSCNGCHYRLDHVTANDMRHAKANGGGGQAARAYGPARLSDPVKVGYADPSYFARAFRKYAGLPPQAYRSRSFG